jgi:hypothetical protein
MWPHRCKVPGFVVVLLFLLASSCFAQTSVHLDAPSKVNLSGERFAFKVNVMGTGNPVVIRSFPAKVPMAAFVTVSAQPAKRFLVGPHVARNVKKPDQVVPCGGTTARVTFYFGLDEKKTRALFINLEPGDGVLLDCQLSGQVEAINLQ